MSLGISMIAASESLMLAKRLKMDIKKVHEIIKAASGNNWAMTNYTPLPNLTDGVPSNNKYRPGFTAAMMRKDLRLAMDAAQSVDASTPLGKAALEIFSKFGLLGSDKYKLIFSPRPFLTKVLTAKLGTTPDL